MQANHTREYGSYGTRYWVVSPGTRAVLCISCTAFNTRFHILVVFADQDVGGAVDVQVGGHSFSNVLTF
jgi:hypothetical protein